MLVYVEQTPSLDTLRKDLDVKIDRPSWPLSSYGPAKFQETIIGHLDESPEELRVKAAQAAKANAYSDYVRRISITVCAKLTPRVDDIRGE